MSGLRMRMMTTSYPSGTMVVRLNGLEAAFDAISHHGVSNLLLTVSATRLGPSSRDV